MIRRCSYHRKTCSKINSFSKTEQLKRNKSLIVIHGQNPVKFFILPASEKTICGKRSVDQSGFVFCFFYHRTYDVFIFISDDSAITTVRIQTQNCDQGRSEEHTSELQSRGHLVCRLLLEKKNIK